MPTAFHPLELAIYYLIAINFAAFAAFGIDKARAEAGAWRISEGTLLTLALFGGSPGAYAGRRAFRHKTRKQPFCSQLAGVVCLQIGGAAALGFVTVGGAEGDAAQLGEQTDLSFVSTPETSAASTPDWQTAPVESGPIDDTPSGLGLAAEEWGHAEDTGNDGYSDRPSRARFSGGSLIGCDAVRAAGRAPLYRGDPDYHPAMDRDGDGIACEPLRR